jgi:hypothetical protein
MKTQKEKKEETPKVNIEHILEVRFGKERVDAWKKQFAPRLLNVFVIEDKVAVLQPVTASAMATYGTAFAQGNGIDVATSRLMDELWLDGDDCMRNDDEYFAPLMLQMENAMVLKKSTFYRV